MLSAPKHHKYVEAISSDFSQTSVGFYNKIQRSVHSCTTQKLRLYFTPLFSLFPLFSSCIEMNMTLYWMRMQTVHSMLSGFTLKSATWRQASPIASISSTVRRATVSSTTVSKRERQWMCVCLCACVCTCIWYSDNWTTCSSPFLVLALISSQHETGSVSQHNPAGLSLLSLSCYCEAS